MFRIASILKPSTHKAKVVGQSSKYRISSSLWSRTTKSCHTQSFGCVFGRTFMGRGVVGLSKTKLISGRFGRSGPRVLCSGTKAVLSFALRPLAGAKSFHGCGLDVLSRKESKIFHVDDTERFLSERSLAVTLDFIPVLMLQDIFRETLVGASHL